MFKEIEKIAGKNTPLCEAIQGVYALCEGVAAPTAVAYSMLDDRFAQGGEINTDELADSVRMVVANDQSLYNMLMNTRTKAHGIAWLALQHIFTDYLEYNESPKTELSSEQIKRWFARHGVDYQVAMAPAVAKVEELREEDRA